MIHKSNLLSSYITEKRSLWVTYKYISIQYDNFIHL